MVRLLACEAAVGAAGAEAASAVLTAEAAISTASTTPDPHMWLVSIQQTGGSDPFRRRGR